MCVLIYLSLFYTCLFFPLDAVTLGLRCFNRGFSPISAAGPGATGAALLKSLIYVQDQHEKSDHK